MATDKKKVNKHLNVEGVLLGIEMALRLASDSWSMSIQIRQATNEYVPSPTVGICPPMIICGEHISY